MSKQTATRQARRATRKQAQYRRELRAATKRELWLSENLQQALTALQISQGKTEKLTPKDVRAEAV